MLPRLRPRRFYDLVIEVAIVRPGPIQGGMIHPYLKHRDRVRQGGKIEYANDALKPALERTLGVPIFQEQVMQIAMIAAGFTGAEADRLRRSMAAWKRRGGVHQFQDRLVQGMLKNGYSEAFAQGIFQQILGFGEYGFPESHAASFALLAYDSSWLKCHEPECFLAAMLNSQPMGFYSPSQLVQDARRHGVQVFPPDVCFSDWDCTLEWLAGEGVGAARPGVRLGLRMISGLSQAGVAKLVQARAERTFGSTEDMALRSQLDVKDVNALAAGDALQSLSGHRRQQVWDARAFVRPTKLLQSAPLDEPALSLPQASEGEEIVFDYASLGLTLRRHPLALLRPRLDRWKLQTSAQLHDVPNGRKVRACGIVTVRQQPQTANGTIFLTLEDETGPVNVIVWKSLREQQREELLLSRLLAVEGVWQRDVESGGNVRNLIAHRLKDLSSLLGRLGRQPSWSRDFH
jgi:error-prone DNA polymerase